ncbi:STAS domain-containing protein [Fibrobacter sp.]|uniref:STAS domain-containing protein n=1 Tax=Fibrobacter sp. TaxID=35828 RepID=UPI00388E77B2
MTIDFTSENNNLSVALNGRLDSSSSGDLECFLEGKINEQTASLTFDFTNVDFISSKGLRILVEAYKKMDGRPMSIVNTNTSVKEILHLSGLLKVFHVA